MQLKCAHHIPVFGGVFQLSEREVVKVAGEPRGDGVTPTSWGSHRTHKCNVHQLVK